MVGCRIICSALFFFFNDTATTEISPLSLHDALPISSARRCRSWASACARRSTSAQASASSTSPPATATPRSRRPARSEEHTSELQSRQYLVCRLLLEKKKKVHKYTIKWPKWETNTSE